MSHRQLRPPAKPQSGASLAQRANSRDRGFQHSPVMLESFEIDVGAVTVATETDHIIVLKPDPPSMRCEGAPRLPRRTRDVSSFSDSSCVMNGINISDFVNETNKELEELEEKDEDRGASLNDDPQPEHLAERARPVFHLDICLKQLVYQCLAPLSGPIMVYCHGWDAPYRQLIWPTTSQGGLAFVFSNMNHIALTVFFLMLVVYPDHFKDNGFMHLSEVKVTVCLFAMYKLLISVKYGSLTRREYANFMKSSVAQGAKYLDEIQLLGAWLDMPPGIAAHELMLQSKAYGVTLTDHNLHVYNYEGTMDDWARFLRMNDCIKPDLSADRLIPPVEGERRRSDITRDSMGLAPGSDGTIDASTFMLGMLLKATQDSKSLAQAIPIIGITTALAMASIGPIIRVTLQGMPLFGTSPMAKVMAVLVVLCNLLFGLPINAIFSACLISSWRTMELSRVLLSVIRTSHDSTETDVPVLAFDHPSTVRSWLLVWQLSLRFGQRFRARQDTAIGVGGCLLIILSSQFLMLSFRAESRYDLLESPLVWYTIFTLVWWGGIMLAVLALSAASNKSFALAELFWLHHRLMIRSGRVSQSGEIGTDDEELEETMSTVLETIEAVSRLEPLRFCGFEATGGLVWSFVSVWGSLLLYVAQRIINA